MKLNPTMLCDFYKVGHKDQYPKNTKVIYSTWTCRASRIEGIDSTVMFGLQGFIKEILIDYFNENFFQRDIEEVLAENREAIEGGLGIINPDLSHITELWVLGRLPIRIDALMEGTSVPIRVPSFTIQNTNPRFFWLTNALETLISTETWSSITTATIAREYRKILDKFAMETTGSTEGVDFQAHDFSMRGMSGFAHAAKAGCGHLLSFLGTDCVPSLFYLKDYYGGDMANCGIGGSIPATEHSVECANMPEDLNELAQTKRLITEIYPTGLVSRVSDTNDFWRHVTEDLPLLKDVIMAREGKLVIRPDSGDPVDIVCGYLEKMTDGNLSQYDGDELHFMAERKGLIEVLWDIFGGTTNDLGFKVLDEHIGAIYGDSITMDRATEICSKLKAKGFASTNIVLGVGSYSYQYHTRDTFGMAFKSTYTLNADGEKLLSKDPKTDNGVKKSQRGMVAVIYDDVGELICVDSLDALEKTWLKDKDLLVPIFMDGYLLVDQTLEKIRGRMKI